MKKGVIAILLFLFFCMKAQAQTIPELTVLNPYCAHLELNVNGNHQVHYSTENVFPFTSLLIVTDEYTPSIDIAYTTLAGVSKTKTCKFSLNEDQVGAGKYSSGLLVFDGPQNSIDLGFENFNGTINVVLIYAPPFTGTSEYSKLNKAGNKCDKPPMISYTVWRTGLPDPKPPREETEVEHLVVHHSAGSNTDTNYINTVRNIYLLHTQSNGWDDIGYNFLIAPNGVVFNGRDPQMVADDDNILGAHFCGKNQNTMGICLMGNFMQTKPTSRALQSLEYLLAWKLKKDGLDAFGQSVHPHTGGSLLNTICGHRDGCSTDCPGDSLYALLSTIKKESARIADSCGLILDTKIISQVKSINLFPNPSLGTIMISGMETSGMLELVTPQGMLILSTAFKTNESFPLFLPAGLYFYRIFENHKNLNSGKLIIHNQ